MWVENAKTPVTQGSIIDGIDWGYEDSPLSIVMSNACDLAHEGHCGFVIVAALESAVDVLRSSREFQGKIKDAKNKKLSARQKKSLHDLLCDYIHNRTICRHYFFDGNPLIDVPGGLVVDFQQIKTIEYKDINSFNVIAQLRHPFVEQMLMRFTSYTARIPVDRVDDDKLNGYLDAIAGDYLF